MIRPIPVVLQTLQETPFNRLKWFRKQCHVLGEDTHCTREETAGTIYLKYDKYLFTSLQRVSFIQRWALYTQNVGPARFYELIPCAQPTRLHLDIEGLYKDNIDESIKVWLLQILAYINQALVSYCGTSHESFEQYQVGNDCRRKGVQYKRSFHLIFYNVFFENNHVVMKDFIHNHLVPIIRNDTTMTAQGKCVVDTGIYTRHRAFRLCWGSKDGKTRLRPWDVGTWQECLFTTVSDREVYLEQTLISGTQGRSAFLVPTRLSSTKQKRTHTDIWIDVQSERKKRICCKHTPASPLTEPGVTVRESPPLLIEQEEVARLLGFLSPSRAKNYETWYQIAWIVAAVYNGSTTGLEVFDTFSQGADNYSEESVRKIYLAYDGRYKLTKSTLHYWAKQDAPVAYKNWKSQRKRNDLINALFSYA